MLQHAQHITFRPLLHQPGTIPAAPMRAQDSSFHSHLSRGTIRPTFVPITAFQRATQKSFSSTRRGRWGSLHVCIAWKIYHQERLKKMQKRPKHEPTILPDEEELQESEESNPDPPPGHFGKPPENLNHLKRVDPSDLHTAAPSSRQSGASRREEPEHYPGRLWKEKLDEKEKLQSQQINKTKDLLVSVQTAAGRFGSSSDRKRRLESAGVKRAKLETVEVDLDPSHIKPGPRIGDFSVLYPYRTHAGHVVYPRPEPHRYQTMWDPNKTTDLYLRQHLKGMSFSPCRVIRRPCAAQKDPSHRYTPLYAPLALRQQEVVYGREGGLLHPHHDKYQFYCCRYQIPHTGLLGTSHLQL